jgi:hypothetical protein
LLACRRLGLFRTVDATKGDTFSLVVVQDFEGVAVEDGDDEAMILRDSVGRRGCQDGKEHTKGPYRKATGWVNREGHGGLAGRYIAGG